MPVAMAGYVADEISCTHVHNLTQQQANRQDFSNHSKRNLISIE